MQLATVQAQNTRLGTCPHGLPIGACPICNGMGGGGGVSRRDVPRNAGEMTYNQCAAIGAMMKAQKLAKQTRENEQLQFLQNIANFQKNIENMSQKLSNLTQFIAQTTPAIIAKPINFILNTVANGVLNLIKNLPNNIINMIQTISQKFIDISEKLTAIMGELKASIEKTISETIKTVKKKIKSLFRFFNSENADENDIELDETKKAFELKTFIHNLYNKITKQKKDLEKDER